MKAETSTITIEISADEANLPCISSNGGDSFSNELNDHGKLNALQIWIAYGIILAMSPFILWNGCSIALYIYAITILFFFGNIYNRFSICSQFGLFAATQIGLCIALFQIHDGFVGYLSFPVLILDAVGKYFLIIRPTVFLFQNYSHKWFITFFLPTLWIGWEQIWSLTPILNMTSVVASQVENSLVQYLASYFGAIFLSWPAFWMASVVYLYYRYPKNWQYQKKIILPIAVILWIMTLPGTELKFYYQYPSYSKTEAISVACMHNHNAMKELKIAPRDIQNIDGLKKAFTSKLDLIIFPEQSGDWVLQSFLHKYEQTETDDVKKTFFPQDEDYKPIVVYGCADEFVYTVYGGHYNALYVDEISYSNEEKNLTIKRLYIYDKLNPVPGEAISKAKIPYPESFQLGKFETKTSGAICYDFSNPETIRKLSWPGVDMMINISNTWKRHFATGISKENKYRGIENGFWTLKCDSAGKVLYTSPFGDIYYQYGPELSKSQFFVQFDIENPQGVFTFYKYGGFVFPWVCMCILMAFTIYDIYRYLSEKYGKNHSKYKPSTSSTNLG